jgi:predicted ATPase
MGKTRLAGEVARAAAARGGRLHWVDLGAITQPEKIAPAIANAAGLPLGEGSPGPHLARALMGRETLLILDNCEHLARDVATLVHAILQGAPGVRVVATSQEALHVAGEHVFRLGALALPPIEASLQEARNFAAVQLLEQRAMAADGRFALGEESIAQAISICRHLDGIPLAIEMAAARLPVLGAEALLRRLDERLRLLKATTREAPARQQTLQATLDWSHSLLSNAERVAFRRLGAFVGSFRLELAQRVAGWGDLDEWSALDALMGLADKSLLQVEGHDPPRYRLLESARVHALAELGRHDETDQTMARHGEAMAAFAEAGGDLYWRMVESPSPARWYPDYDDLHAAWDRAADRGRHGRHGRREPAALDPRLRAQCLLDRPAPQGGRVSRARFGRPPPTRAAVPGCLPFPPHPAAAVLPRVRASEETRGCLARARRPPPGQFRPFPASPPTTRSRGASRNAARRWPKP